MRLLFGASYIAASTEKNAKLITDDTKLTRKVEEYMNTHPQNIRKKTRDIIKQQNLNFLTNLLIFQKL
ncbi:hypothetical protein CW703_05405 [Candidatus Bathyarchaeota archaeon]|nr:MAG: hypothetical protein CW703_05405 [Candidatus Bathyarchaeota archaeon]